MSKESLDLLLKDRPGGKYYNQQRKVVRSDGDKEEDEKISQVLLVCGGNSAESSVTG